MFGQVSGQVLFASELELQLLSCDIYETAFLRFYLWVGLHAKFVDLIITQFAGGPFKSRAELGLSVVSYQKDMFPETRSAFHNSPATFAFSLQSVRAPTMLTAPKFKFYKPGPSADYVGLSTHRLCCCVRARTMLRQSKT